MSRFWYFWSFVSIMVAIGLLVRDPMGSALCAGTGYLFYWMADRIDPFS